MTTNRSCMHLVASVPLDDCGEVLRVLNAELGRISVGYLMAGPERAPAGL